MRTNTERGSNPASSRHGATDGAMILLAAKRQGVAFIRSSNTCRSVSAVAANGTGGEPPSSAGRRHHSAGLSSTSARTSGSFSQTVGTLGRDSASPSSRVAISGRKAANAGASARPLPGLLTMRT